ncbi:arginine-tRNA-protein transferase [Spirosoma sp. RP8]|uniref:Arginine-tRNA-protein transferase n=1 Tax=Spirosoma liriopis TaxID=2937440 RepID=A0ABT0HN82_9BACT|nr:arginine-tRNA-protein transferase [Spirosoma liriopis]MCK8493629.1 arginine-tRNA-protein transferase [Spirosoma liriopis]
MKGSKLDFCLSKGYFRMQQDLFTCRYVFFDDTFYSVHWLRLVLPNVQFGTKQRRLLRINESYSVSVKPFSLTQELEGLYSLYRQSIDFDAPESVESCLLAGATYNLFDTNVVEVRDKGMLIAAGIFDAGLESIAGIMNFYHPAYRKQSLGKFLMLQKINHARLNHKIYYYPGYLVNNYPKFDYKLFACESATEVFDDGSGQWLPFSWETIAMQAGFYP